MAADDDRTDNGAMAADGDIVAEHRRGVQCRRPAHRRAERGTKTVGIKREIRTGMTAKQRARQMRNEKPAANATVWRYGQPIEQQVDTSDRSRDPRPTLRMLPMRDSMQRGGEHRCAEQ